MNNTCADIAQQSVITPAESGTVLSCLELCTDQPNEARFEQHQRVELSRYSNPKLAVAADFLP